MELSLITKISFTNRLSEWQFFFFFPVCWRGTDLTQKMLELNQLNSILWTAIPSSKFSLFSIHWKDPGWAKKKVERNLLTKLTSWGHSINNFPLFSSMPLIPPVFWDFWNNFVEVFRICCWSLVKTSRKFCKSYRKSFGLILGKLWRNAGVALNYWFSCRYEDNHVGNILHKFLYIFLEIL